MMRRLAVACTVAMLVPLCAVTLFFALVSAGETLGATPFAGLTPRNSAEAAALGRAADVLRFLRAGEDPRRVHPVDPGVISSAVRRATTVEAAMWSRQLALVKLLDREGALPEGAERHDLACLAADLGLPEVAAYLAGDGAARCESGRALARVLARTSAEGE